MADTYDSTALFRRVSRAGDNGVLGHLNFLVILGVLFGHHAVSLDQTPSPPPSLLFMRTPPLCSLGLGTLATEIGYYVRDVKRWLVPTQPQL